MNFNRSVLSTLQPVYNQSESNAQSLGCLVSSGRSIKELKVCVWHVDAASIRLPSPPLAGRSWELVRPGTEIELNDTDDLGKRDALILGPLTLFVHLSGEKLAIRMLNAESALLKSFTGLKWFPIDPAYRAVARFAPFDAPKPVEVPNILGDLERYTSPGVLTFTLHGQEYQLQPFQVGKQETSRFFIVFKDLTSGKETYGAARFVNASQPKDGTTIIDFNRAFNPPARTTRLQPPRCRSRLID